VSAEDKATGKKNTITITNASGRLSKEDVERMVREAETFAAEDASALAQAQARNDLDAKVYAMKAQLAEEGDGGDDDNKQACAATLDKVVAWLDEHDTASAEEIATQNALLDALKDKMPSKSTTTTAEDDAEATAPTVEEVD
jgi:molecular chaperone DnaK (HSP70)